jgi:hypothetical protein
MDIGAVGLLSVFMRHQNGLSRGAYTSHGFHLIEPDRDGPGGGRKIEEFRINESDRAKGASGPAALETEAFAVSTALEHSPRQGIVNTKALCFNRPR